MSRRLHLHLEQAKTTQEHTDLEHGCAADSAVEQGNRVKEVEAFFGLFLPGRFDV